MSECDRCGLEDPCYCQCYVSELENRITYLEEKLDKLTFELKLEYDIKSEKEDNPPNVDKK